jgi:pimeloyl-ACP methyl ester carboxylesterase
MSRLASAASSRGYCVINWGYRSLWSSIEDHAQRLLSTFDQLESDTHISQFHLVTHSMGSIISRAAVQRQRPRKLGRFVMLGPPNHGSHVARRLAPSLGWLCPPLFQLSDDQNSFVNQLPEPAELEIGIIAATRDRVVSQESTRLQAQRDWIMLPGHHGVLPCREETVVQVVNFLQRGTFRQQATGDRSDP